MILKKVEGRHNPRALRDSRLTMSGLYGHTSTPNSTPGDSWGVSLNLHDPLLRLTERHLRQTGGNSIGQVSTDCATGGDVRPILTTPGPARVQDD